MKQNRLRVAAGATVLLIAAGMLLHRPLRELAIRVALDQAVHTVNEARVLSVPLSSEDTSLIRRMARIAPRFPRGRYDIALRLQDLAEGDESPFGARARGLASLLGGDARVAIKELSRVESGQRDVAVWSNLAAAFVTTASVSGDPDDLLSALVASDRALAIAGDHAPAVFIRALALQSLGLQPAAEVVWCQYLRMQESQWSLQARNHLQQLQSGDSERAWQKATAAIEGLSEAQIATLSADYPQQARTWGESLYVLAWAEAILGGRNAAASAELRQLRVIASALDGRNGERLLSEVVQSMEAAVSRGNTRVLAEAFIRYRDGRIGQRHRPAKAMADLLFAMERFKSLSSPMALLSECYVAVAFLDLNQIPEARRRLDLLIRAERAAGSHHHALLAFALYHLALCDAALGNWSDALASAAESLNISTRLGEDGQAGTTEALIAQCYDFVGDRSTAWQHGRRAVALLLRAGDRNRARITVAGLSRIELRSARWESARSLIQAERIFARGVTDPRLDTDLFLRLSIATARLDERSESVRTLSKARDSAKAVSDEAIQMKLTADADAVAGALAREANPPYAETLLTRAIEFQERAHRALLLPQLYLERGRTRRAMRHLAAAEADFERGARSLEQQRVRTDSELRAGIFDDAEDLFRDAVALALEQHDPVRAFSWMERGRARAVVEQIASQDSDPVLAAPAVTIVKVAQSLPAGALMVEYVALEHMLAIFTIDTGGLSVRTIAVSRAAIDEASRRFLHLCEARGSDAEMHRAAGQVFNLFLGPLKQQLERSNRLIIVPDPTLTAIPYAALFDAERSRYLIQDRVVTTAPSAAIFVVNAERSSRLRRHEPPRSAALFANPASAAGSFADLGALPGSEREVRNAARSYAKSRIFLREQATVLEFLAAAPEFEVVHFGGHSVTRAREPWRSALLFAPTSGDDGLLSVRQVARMAFRDTRVIVLASCSTLRGHTKGIEGVPSVSRAFVIAGVPIVIGTLWDVEDGETSVLVQVLHAKLAKGVEPADALRGAQVEALSSPVPELRHPGYWAAFEVLGFGR